MSSAVEASIRLSVAVIARNAAEALAETLVSVRNMAGEIIVLDTGSTDETREIARALGACVFDRPWDDSFAAARNAALTFVQGKWVLWLDAGETLGKDEGRLLAEFVEQHADPSTAYFVQVSLPAADGETSGEQIARLRLHPRRPGLQFLGRTRESLDRSLFAFGITTQSLPLTIQRGGREFDPTVKSARAERNLVLADLQLAERGASAEMHNCLGESYQCLGKQEKAAQHYRLALDCAEKGSPSQLEAYYGLLTCLETISPPPPPEIDELDPRRSAQLSLCTTALETFPLDAQLLCALGGYLQSLGRSDLAVRAYEVCYRHGQIEPQVWHLPFVREIAASCQGAILETIGQTDEALAILQDARQAYPQSLRIGRQLLEQHVQQGRRDEALVVANQLPLEAAAREALRVAIVGACAAVKGNWTAARSYLNSAIEAGCRERFALRWLCTAVMAAGNAEEIEQVLRRWEAADPASPEPAQFRRSLAEAAARGPAAVEADDAGGRSVRIDAPQEAVSPALPPAAAPNSLRSPGR